jgi:hypothetical protein
MTIFIIILSFVLIAHFFFIEKISSEYERRIETLCAILEEKTKEENHNKKVKEEFHIMKKYFIKKYPDLFK